VYIPITTILRVFGTAGGIRTLNFRCWRPTFNQLNFYRAKILPERQTQIQACFRLFGGSFVCQLGSLTMIGSVRSARIDDLRRGVGYMFNDLDCEYAAHSLDQVRHVLVDANTAARNGNWVIGFLTYEAGPAFDSAIPARSTADGFPLAWFGVYRQRAEVEPINPPDSPPAVGDVRRLGGGDWYQDCVEQIRSRIAAGDVYQVNLTDRLVADFEGDSADLYRAMATAQGGAFNAHIEFEHASIVSASPELFITFSDGVVATRPMKGTAARRARQDDDRRAATQLRASLKEQAENVMIVDLLRNDLSRVALPGGVSVPALLDTERFETVWQLTSTVRAELPDTVELGDVLAATFPCGSITGAPKIAAAKMIAELEPWPRGVYCGSIGVISPHTSGGKPSAVFNVAIRTAIIDRRLNTLTFGAGGGITWDSYPPDENREVEAKSAVLTAIRPEFRLIETLRLDQHGPQHLDRHLARIESSAEYFGFRCERTTIHEKVNDLAVVEHPSRLRIELAKDGRVEVTTGLLGPERRTVTLAVDTRRVRSNDPFCCHKTTQRTHYVEAASRQPGVDDVIMVNERYELVETTIASLLFEIDGEWFVPPLSCGGLDGIGRQILVENRSVRERAITIDEIDRISRFEVVSSLRGRRRAVLVDR
jgi:para-aminobenzoate synthetase / 4-amino-4-deoxychorismate lyase